MKKRYEMPCVQVEAIATEDIIRTSLTHEENGVAPTYDISAL